MSLKTLILLVAVLFILSFVCVWLSVHSMDGYVDCRLDEPFMHDSFPADPLPNNCASGLRLLMQTLFGYFAIAFGFATVLLPIFIRWRQRKFSNSEIDSIDNL